MKAPACAATQRRLAAVAGVASELGRSERHFQQCLRCQAEAVKYRKLARSLSDLARTPEPAPPGLAAAVQHRIAGPAPVASTQRAGHTTRAAAAMVGALAAAAGTAVVVRMLRTRSAA